MSFLNDLFAVSIATQGVSPTRPSFGIPLVMASNLPGGFGSNLVRQFSALSDLTDMGVGVTDALYLAVEILLSAENAVDEFLVGKIVSGLAIETIHLTVPDAVGGHVYAFTADGGEVSYAVPGSGSPTTTTVAAGIAAAINALSPTPQIISATSSGAVVSIVAASGKVFDVSGWKASNLLLTDVTPDNGIATDLANIKNVRDDWYGVLFIHSSSAISLGAAAWMEANGKIAVFDNSDGGNYDSVVTTDVLSLASGLTYARSCWFISRDKLLAYKAFGMVGNQFPTDPGADTWAFKPLPGVAADAWTDTEYENALAKNGNMYVSVLGESLTFPGISTAVEYMDIVRGRDWMQSNTQINLFATVTALPKVPYTNTGADIIRQSILGSLKQAVAADVLSKDVVPTVSVPDVTTLSSGQRRSRVLPNVTFAAQFAGAIHAAPVAGVVSY